MVLTGLIMIGFGLGIGVLGLSMLLEWFSWNAPKALVKILGVVFILGGAALLVAGVLKLAGVI